MFQKQGMIPLSNYYENGKDMMKYFRKTTLNKITLYALLLFFFLFSFNLQGQTTLWLSLIVGASLLYFVANPVLPKDINVMILLLTMLTYILFSHGRYLNGGGIIRFLFGVPVLYYAGFIIAEKVHFESPKLIGIIMIFSLGFVLYQFLNLITSYSEMGSTRNAVDYWTGQIIQPTNFNSKGLFIVAFAIPVILSTKRITSKVILSVLMVYVAVASVLTASRTNLILIFLSAILTALFTFSYQFSAHIPKKPLTRKKLIAIFIVVLAIVWAVVQYGDAITSWLEMSALANRLSTNDSRLQISNDGRWFFWSETIKMLLKNPMGNPSTFYAHNLFLDVGRVSGIIPMILLIWFFIRLTKNWWIIIRKKTQLDFETKRTFFVAFSIFFIAFMIEPVLEGRPSEFIAFMFFAGVINAYGRKYRNTVNS